MSDKYFKYNNHFYLRKMTQVFTGPDGTKYIEHLRLFVNDEKNPTEIWYVPKSNVYVPMTQDTNQRGVDISGKRMRSSKPKDTQVQKGGKKRGVTETEVLPGTDEHE